jgi:glutathione S-transferase
LQPDKETAMKLYYSPGACSIGIDVLLEEIGKPYKAQLVNLRDREQYKPPFTRINPKSKVPTVLRDDGMMARPAVQRVIQQEGFA